MRYVPNINKYNSFNATPTGFRTLWWTRYSPSLCSASFKILKSFYLSETKGPLNCNVSAIVTVHACYRQRKESWARKFPLNGKLSQQRKKKILPRHVGVPPTFMLISTHCLTLNKQNRLHLVLINIKFYYYPPCKVEMNATRSPSVNGLSSKPLSSQSASFTKTNTPGLLQE